MKELEGKRVKTVEPVEGGAEIHVTTEDGEVFVFSAQGQDKPHGPFVVVHRLG